jgi:hypothetical protein
MLFTANNQSINLSSKQEENQAMKKASESKKEVRKEASSSQ